MMPDFIPDPAMSISVATTSLKFDAGQGSVFVKITPRSSRLGANVAAGTNHLARASGRMPSEGVNVELTPLTTAVLRIGNFRAPLEQEFRTPKESPPNCRCQYPTS